jgi:predicted XRE-type DNA-binding protein
MQLDHPVSAGALAAATAALPRVLASDRIKMLLMARLREMRQSRGMTQIQAATWFGVSQPRISHLAQNRVNRFTVDTLINMLAHAGVRVSVTYQTDRNEVTTPAEHQRSEADGR